MHALLIIEDDQKLAQFLIHEFEKKKFKCDHAISGLDGMNMLLAKTYDVAVVDLRLPELSGTKIIEQLSKWENKTPIVVITGFDDLKTKKKILSLKVFAFIEKPFEFSELFAEVEKAMRQN